MSPQLESVVTSPFEWRSELLLDVQEIDRQHRELLARASVLRHVINATGPRHAIQAKMSELIDYTEMHFGSEEKMMLAHDYRGYATHKAAHTELLDQIYMVRQELSTGSLDPGHMLVLFLQAWTSQHILGPDKQFVAFLKSESGA